jgi:hypothetical protein
MGPKGPEILAQICTDGHWEMILKARDLNLRMFERFADYYGDARVLRKELHEFQDQMRQLSYQANSPELTTFLEELDAVVDYAIVEGKPVLALAD